MNALLHHCEGGLSGVGGVARPGIVHQLDKDTSGCLVVAKNDETHVALSAQFAGRTVHKVYHAILCGELPRERRKSAPVSRATCFTFRENGWRWTTTEGAEHTSYEVLSG